MAGTDQEGKGKEINFTDRQIEVLDLVAQGLTARKIARRLHCSLWNVQKFMRRTREKAGLIHTKKDLKTWLQENGW